VEIITDKREFLLTVLNCECRATYGIVRRKPAHAIITRLLEEIRGEQRRG
jgi:hypothetical protein